ncbi:type II secretion system F family protein [Oscillatoria salina]|uniref:type II secretion system F family protein n=1 Tax=Oscillatoria salina TaxID=331517 RepID=UPI0013BCB470|nr:type II secretion system F family protein [Oscillatoria salina]MBZ8179995.1 bacterial type II secretion system protein F domain protein [Oscillatoria salina IIICB1]NET90342.1 bacterial type II secretion system protein F domain protein [Kamptonema sp. SIO1D9]
MNCKQKAQFFSQLANLLKSGLSVQQSLTLAGNKASPAFKSYLQSASINVAKGQDLASALAKNNRFLDSWTISLIRLSEWGSSLAEICESIAEATEKQIQREKLYRSIRLYAIAALWSLLTAIAAILNATPSGLVKPEFWLRSISLGLVLLGVSFLASRFQTANSQQLTIELPLVGKIVEARSLIFLGQLHLPLHCGVPILTAIELVRTKIPDPIARKNLSIAAKKILSGQSFTQSLTGKIPPPAIQIIRTGEETGNLDLAMERLAAYYEDELQQRLQLFLNSLRPLTVLTFGTLVAVIAVKSLTFMLDSLPS